VANLAERHYVLFQFGRGDCPDLDGVYHTIIKKGNINDQNFQHHLYYPTHWPSTYLPVVIAFLFSLIFDFYPQYFLIAVVGPGTHLIFDSISCGDGMMWAAAWWKVKRGEFGKFTNLDSKMTDGYPWSILDRPVPPNEILYPGKYCRWWGGWVPDLFCYQWYL